MKTREPFCSVFSQVFDVAVFGGGYAGVAACRRLAAAGQRVLLLDRTGDLLWESGRAFERQAGSEVDSGITSGGGGDWQRWVQHLDGRGAFQNGQIVPAAAEVLANQVVVGTAGLSVLYYVAPIAVEWSGDALAAVIVATKAGLRRIVARRFLDATERGDLLALMPTPPVPRQPDRQRLSIYFLRPSWPDAASHAITCPAWPDARLSLEPSCWPLERCLSVELPGHMDETRAAWLPALRSAREQLHDMLDGALVTHGSVVPLPIYDRAVTTSLRLPTNVASAAPALATQPCATLADRHQLGVLAADALLDQPQADGGDDLLGAPMPVIRPGATRRGDVAIAGLGTGGLLAAVAAARQGASVVAFDPLAFSGGIGAGGGIHVYYHGVTGGLQEELDGRIRQITPLFGRTAQIRGYHPDARKVVAAELLCEAGVTRLQGMLASVEVRDGRLVGGTISTTAGALRVEAHAWIDATGDGDLAAMAGATMRLGRSADGQTHAYSQSSGRAGIAGDAAIMHCVNFDAGFVDPTDPEDLTRARLTGIGHYEQQRFRNDDHPTGIAPIIGIRQGRHIEADRDITLADLIGQRKFDDCIGYCGCHYDNHAIDYELESDESMFWVWVCRGWWEPLRCEIPYRSLLPRTLTNVWMACRALGVTPEAHCTIRMQRDIQRIGEVAGLAAAQAAAKGVDSRRIDMERLRGQLLESRAIRPRLMEAVNSTAASTPQAWLDALHETAEPGYALWNLYQAGPNGLAEPLAALLRTGTDDASWRAACILAMWGDPRAQARLCAAIDRREDGTGSEAPSPRLVPRWVVAVALLRICGREDCLKTLDNLASLPGLVVNVRTLIAVACRQVLSRSDVSGSGSQVATILDHLLGTTPPLTAASPQRLWLSPQLPPPATHGYWTPRVIEDITWPMHLEIARTRMLLGQPPHDAALALLDDPRRIVRTAAQRTLETTESALSLAFSHSTPAPSLE